MNRVSFILRCLHSKFSRLIDNYVFFDSFHGQYNDNPKYISEELHKKYPQINIVWSVSEKNHEQLPAYVTKVKYGSSDYYKYALNSEVVVDNQMGIRSFGFKSFRIWLADWILRKKGQLSIATWHGTPLKKIGKDTLNKRVVTYYTAIRYCVSNSDYYSQKVGEAFFLGEKIRKYGLPRNDILVVPPNESEVIKLKKKLGLPLTKKIVLYAPTHRKRNTKLSGLNQFEQLDMSELLGVLENRFSEEFAFALRVHHTVVESFCKQNDLKNSVINGNTGDDMSEYLLCADVLITDYSSVFFDYAITKKPCFLFMPDLEWYSEEVGMYMDVSELPFPASKNMKELSDVIKSFDYNKYKSSVESFLCKLGSVDDGHASERVTNDIIAHLQCKNKLK